MLRGYVIQKLKTSKVKKKKKKSKSKKKKNACKNGDKQT